MGAGMDGESLRVGDPKIWGAGVVGVPKEGMDGEPQRVETPQGWGT